MVKAAVREAELSGEAEEEVSDRPTLRAGPAGRMYINAKQYFEGILPLVWQFRIGGYRVCEKWLKDRKGRTLAQIDSLIADHGGWPLN
jgi:hypothetical protein